MRCAEKINIVGTKFEFMRLSKALNEIEVNSSVRILHGRAEFARGKFLGRFVKREGFEG
jgi:hypothetical protein